MQPLQYILERERARERGRESARARASERERGRKSARAREGERERERGRWREGGREGGRERERERERARSMTHTRAPHTRRCYRVSCDQNSAILRVVFRTRAHLYKTHISYRSTKLICHISYKSHIGVQNSYLVFPVQDSCLIYPT